MTLYAKVFAQIFDSSLADDWQVRHVFIDLLILADRHGVGVHFACVDVEANPDSWNGPWDVVNVQRFLHRESLGLIPARLAPGGIVLYETFLEDQARSGRKPKNPAFLLRSGELLEAAAGLTVLHYREGTDDGGDSTAALVARKGDEHAEG